MRSFGLVSALAMLAIAAVAVAPAVAQEGPLPGTSELEGRTIGALQFRGNRKAEDDALRAAIHSRPGEKLSSEQLREDIKNVWKLGFFEDVQVEAVEASSGKIGLTFVLREKPVIRKIYVSGAHEVGLDKINEVLDIKKDQIIDPAKVKRNVEKIKDLYVEKGYQSTCVAVLLWRRRDPDATGFRLPFGPLIPLLSLVGTLFFLLQVSRVELYFGVALLAGGLILGALTRLWSRRAMQ
jgi:outer membrane protein assembly factor BamA